MRAASSPARPILPLKSRRLKTAQQQRPRGLRTTSDTARRSCLSSIPSVRPHRSIAGSTPTIVAAADGVIDLDDVVPGFRVSVRDVLR